MAVKPAPDSSADSAPADADNKTKVRDIKDATNAQESSAGDSKVAPKVSTKPSRPRRRTSLWVSLLIVIVAIVFGAREFQARMHNVFEQDARIAGDLVTFSSRVSGWIIEINVREGDRVEKGQVLARIDARESTLNVGRLEAQIAGLAAERERLVANRYLADQQITSRINTRESELSTARAALEALEPQVKLSREEFERAESLFASKVVPKRQLDQARADMQRLEGEFLTATARRSSANAKLQEAKADVARLTVYDREIQVLEFRRAELEAELQGLKLDLEDRTIRSTIDGVIDRTFVEVGEYVTPGQRIALLHDPSDIWVEANIKETEIRRLKIGQRVDISVDAYPDHSFEGRLESIGNAATSEFALLPSPNPSGNFTKTTQRLRTRIALEQQQDLLRPGMMVEIAINVRGE
jgi:membrane fusion protein (multidrug efflux system)